MKKVITVAAMAATLATQTVMAQEEAAKEPKVSVSAGADLVSTYVWRGANLSSAAFQPSVGMEVAGFSLGLWGSTDMHHVVNEVDWTLAYSISGLTVGFTDYCGAATRQADGTFPKYFKKGSHILEANAAFDFSEVCKKFALSVAANVNLMSDDDHSTYIELGYPVKAGSVDLDFALGFTPADGAYSDNFNVVNLSVKGTKEIQLTDKFALPVYAQGILNPYEEQAYLVFGITF